MEEKIENPLETALTELSSLGLRIEFNQITSNIELYLQNKQIGFVSEKDDKEVIRIDEQWFEIDTIEAIQRMKEYIMQEYNLEDKSAMKITIQYLDDTVKRLSVIDKGDWIDLYAAETVELKQGEFRLIHLGVAMKLPEGYEAHIVPRSSTFKKWGIIQANHMGIVDNSYSGPNDWWKMTALAMRDTVIEKGDKICQFRIMERQPKVILVEGKMEGADRGGFGSTGSK